MTKRDEQVPYVFLPNVLRQTLGTLTPVTLARVPAIVVRDLAANNPGLAEALWRQMLVSVDIQREWTVSVGRRSALERLAHFFCEIWTRLDTVGLASGLECEMPLTQNELADVLGLSTVHVNRSLQELRGNRLIVLHGKRLSILAWRKLADLALFDPAYMHRRAA